MEIIRDPHAIEKKSMEIIDGLLPELQSLPLEERNIIKRVVHTAGDPEYAKIVQISPGAIEAGLGAIRAGKNVVTDVNMLKAGVSAKTLQKFGGVVNCYINDPRIVEQAKETGLTRAIMAMRMAKEEMQGGIIAIGNAPTALFEVMEMIEKGELSPALIVGTPVGFVGARESKEALVEMKTPVPYITVVGNKGGSTIAASIVNALLYMA
jgi:precorrin-8X/cobalt-precorrin-8 methylmutase